MLSRSGPDVEQARVHGTPAGPLTEVRVAGDNGLDVHLLERADLFGLATAADTSRGHFPGISDQPLAVSAARQSATATFGPLGFRAAAVTVMPYAAGSVPPPPPYRAQRIAALYDRPFGFLAVHRASGLVLAAGWVATP
ncbi:MULTISPECIES: hypothetical protein [Streptomyces]|uniref:hypothetical protein n=1 Tax=Streptomyces TaxID=1883 RepID=UPI002B1CB7D5|nr:hypothetical protein [Streptomyces platensis]